MCGRCIPLSHHGALKTEADTDGIVDPLHDGVVKMSHLFLQTALVDRPDLLEQNDGILCKAEAVGEYINMRRQTVFCNLACDGGGDDGRAVFVAHIVLNDEYGTQSSLLRTDDGTEIGIINISAFYSHEYSRSMLLIHQRGRCASLCLYFLPAAAVLNMAAKNF